MTRPSSWHGELWSPEQEARVIAAADLVGRTGARSFAIGYLHDDVPVEEAGWYAHAQYRGARISADDHRSPGDAAEALAIRLLTGARCKCGKLVALVPGGAFAFTDPVMADGSRWSADQAEDAGQCLWRRYGKRWQQGCEPPP